MKWNKYHQSKKQFAQNIKKFGGQDKPELIGLRSEEAFKLLIDCINKDFKDDLTKLDPDEEWLGFLENQERLQKLKDHKKHKRVTRWFQTKRGA